MKGAGCNHELVLTKEGVGLDSSTRKGWELSYTVVERSCRSLVGTARSTKVAVSGSLERLFVSNRLSLKSHDVTDNTDSMLLSFITLGQN